MAGIETRPVGPDELGALRQLFTSQRSTRHCWCMAFCTTRSQFAAGWFGGGNERRFEAMVGAGVPVGVLATVGGEPVGWGAAGPRSRYVGPRPDRHPVLGRLARSEDLTVWLVPCLFVHAAHRSQGVTHALVTAAVSLARQQGAVAVEGWPASGPKVSPGDAFLGREGLYVELGFRRLERQVPGRAIMRLDLAAP